MQQHTLAHNAAFEGKCENPTKSLKHTSQAERILIDQS